MQEPYGGSGGGFFMRLWSCSFASLIALEVHCYQKLSLAIFSTARIYFSASFRQFAILRSCHLRAASTFRRSASFLHLHVSLLSLPYFGDTHC